MANTKPQIYIKIEVGAAGFTKGGGTEYTLTDADNITINHEEQTTTVEDGQTIINAFDADVDILLYDEDILSDANVQTDATIVSEAKFILIGATGVDDLAVDNVRMRAFEDYDTALRKGVRFRASQRATSTPYATS